MSQRNVSKEKIVAEYLSGNTTYRALGVKYQIPHRSICDWVMEYQGRKPSYKDKVQRKRAKEGHPKESEFSNEVKILQSKVRALRLHTKVLEEIIRIGGKETGIDWKKSLEPSSHEHRAI
jgi:hypothetical protein